MISGADGIRIHDVAALKPAILVADAIVRSWFIDGKEPIMKP
jgi:hypothetical protein